MSMLERRFGGNERCGIALASLESKGRTGPGILRGISEGAIVAE
jgi:hypothetical protein